MCADPQPADRLSFMVFYNRQQMTREVTPLPWSPPSPGHPPPLVPPSLVSLDHEDNVLAGGGAGPGGHRLHQPEVPAQRGRQDTQVLVRDPQPL